MPHLYECLQCHTQAPARRARPEDAETDRQTHRDLAHGGHQPRAGDRIRTVHHHSRGDGILPDHSLIAALVLLALVLANCWGR
ncbi:hypothetical protein PYK79_46400 [Streptomyces sp. ID05-04B]|uniref:hypothetical protein n=1 Tax=Streptomyces sp. ID05-04B TaxID=3028661 RepID=UPI0029C2D0E9|nr:hypothetical protein [Streptomyces sp. ID05-04B]MDX5569238.1 hypothetical protein [Streptomyces sp. ID05-04B]